MCNRVGTPDNVSGHTYALFYLSPSHPFLYTHIFQCKHTLSFTLILPLNPLFLYTHTRISSSSTRGPHCVAIYPFTAEGEGELSLTAGDTIELLERVGAEWLKGRRGEDMGIFPSQFVEIKVDLPSSDMKSPGPSTGPTGMT